MKSLVGFLSPKPRSYIDTFDLLVKQAVSDAINKIQPDVIVASQIGAMVYIPDNSSVNILFEELEVGGLHRQVCNLNGIKRFRRQLTLYKQMKLTKAMLHRANVYTCVSDNELRLIKDCYNPKIGGAVIPNGVDTCHYQPTSRNPQPNVILYNGALTYGANLDAVRFYASEIYPIISSTLPNVKLRVSGRTTGVDLSGIADCQGIELTGYVDDIRTELNAATACVVPLHEGGGSRLKILEAMAAGVPVISTSMGIEGIDAVPGEHALIADSPSDFAKAMEQVLIDPAVALKLSVNGKQLVEEQYSWQNIGENFVNLVERVLIHNTI
jgi:glycosyltransferase involved in cell wall biosynthesis